jgi:AcrR family transcriptional regulator
MADTKTLIMDAAERLFGEHGYAATSLRAITAAAKVNLAAVNYHFRSKDELVRAVIARRIAPINAHRIALLDAAEKRAGHGAPPLEDILDAFTRPALEAVEQSGDAQVQLGALLGRAFVEPGGAARFFEEHIRETAVRFLAAFRRSLPALPPADLFWRVHLMVGGMAHTLASGPLLNTLSGGLCDSHDTREAVRQMTAFYAAGLRADAVRNRPRKRKTA